MDVGDLNLAPLYRWFARNKRDLPFRKTRDPYRVWVSEVMSQQTRLQAMLGRYEEFVARFPNLRALAMAREEEVLAAWRGLGYYSRARNLLAGARRIDDEFGGSFPDNLHDALSISGVGDYTAAAVLSICHGAPVPVLDGNVRRVLSRLLDLPGLSDSPRSARELVRTLMANRGRTSPGDHNEALMELGAVVCVPGRPFCTRCPLSKSCAVFRRGGADLAAKIPPKKRERKLDVFFEVFCIYDGRKRRIWVVRERDSRFLRDLWFFPSRHRIPSLGETSETPGLARFGNARRSSGGEFRHQITHHRIRGRVEELVLPGRQPTNLSDKAEWKMIPVAELESVVVSSLAKKVLQALPDG